MIHRRVRRGFRNDAISDRTTFPKESNSLIQIVCSPETYMNASRREFLQQSLAAGSILVTSQIARATFRVFVEKDPVGGGTAEKKLDILILGGTAFLGPATVNAALARGHTVTLFNRGKTRPDLFPNVEKLHGDRDPKKEPGLKALEGRKWD